MWTILYLLKKKMTKPHSELGRKLEKRVYMYDMNGRVNQLPPLKETKVEDKINHPAHYTQHPSGVECIQITEHMGFNLGNAMKYIWRADLKGNAIEDIKKAAWYIDRELERRRLNMELFNSQGQQGSKFK